MNHHPWAYKITSDDKPVAAGVFRHRWVEAESDAATVAELLSEHHRLRGGEAITLGPLTGLPEHRIPELLLLDHCSYTKTFGILCEYFAEEVE